MGINKKDPRNEAEESPSLQEGRSPKTPEIRGCLKGKRGKGKFPHLYLLSSTEKSEKTYKQEKNSESPYSASVGQQEQTSSSQSKFFQDLDSQRLQGGRTEELFKRLRLVYPIIHGKNCKGLADKDHGKRWLAEGHGNLSWAQRPLQTSYSSTPPQTSTSVESKEHGRTTSQGGRARKAASGGHLVG